MLVLSDLLIENQHQRGQHQNNGSHAQHNALGHNDADIPAQRQPHDAQGQKARYRGEAGGGQRAEGSNHRSVAKIGILLNQFIFLIQRIKTFINAEYNMLRIRK